MDTVAVAIMCKTPRAGYSKTRLSPPLHPEECADISGCFIQDLSATIDRVAEDGKATGYAVYTPAGSEGDLRRLLPDGFGILLQSEGDFGVRLLNGVADLIGAGHAGAILVNSDSPTLPRAILDKAVAAVLNGDRVVLSPAIDGGYTLIGLSKPHSHLFADISWSTEVVYAQTLERARDLGLPVTQLDAWYDVDDVSSYALLERELDGIRPRFAREPLEHAPRTRAFVRRRRMRSVAA